MVLLKKWSDSRTRLESDRADGGVGMRWLLAQDLVFHRILKFGRPQDGAKAYDDEGETDESLRLIFLTTLVAATPIDYHPRVH